MDTYVVIHLKNKQEKVSILNLLATETEADYKVTTDLKGFLAKQLNVTIVENKEVRDQATDTGDQEVLGTTNNTLPTVNNHIFDNIIAAQPSDVTADPQNLIINNIMGAVMDFVTEWNAADEYEDASSTPTLLVNSIKRPRNSMDDDDLSSRSGIITKQPKYSVQDDDQELVAKNENIAKKCQKCGTVCIDNRQKRDHVMMHAKLMRYECLVDGCGFESGYKCSMIDHFKSKHKGITRCFKEIELTREQTEEVNTIMEECFTGMPTDRDIVSEGVCQFCRQSVGSCHRRDHALQHAGFFSYKCMEQGCQFESKTTRSMNWHLSRSHGYSAKRNFQTKKLTEEQELEIEEMLVKCFPKIDTNREEVDESDE